MGYTNGAADYTTDTLFFLNDIEELTSVGYGNEHKRIMTIIHDCPEDAYNINQCLLQLRYFDEQYDRISGVICARNENETKNTENEFVALSEMSYGKVLVKNRNDEIGYICTDFWNIDLANLTCQQLGYEPALAYIEYSMALDTSNHTFAMSYLRCQHLDYYFRNQYDTQYDKQFNDTHTIHFYEDPESAPPAKLQDCSYHARNVTCDQGIAGTVCTNTTQESSRVYLEENGLLRAINDNHKLGAICAQHWTDHAVSQIRPFK